MIQNNIKLIVILVVLVSGCYSEADICSTYINYQNDISFNIVLGSIKRSNRKIDLHGYNPITQKKESYSGDASDYYSNYNLMEIGDTIIKNKNEMLYRIKKRDSTVVIYMACYKKDSLVLDSSWRKFSK